MKRTADFQAIRSEGVDRDILIIPLEASGIRPWHYNLRFVGDAGNGVLMLRKARIDAPGALREIIGRGIKYRPSSRTRGPIGSEVASRQDKQD